MISILDEYQNKNNDSLSIANFMLKNMFIVNPNSVKFFKCSIQLWKLLMELLLDVDEKSNKIATKIVLDLYNSTQTNSKYN